MLKRTKLAIKPIYLDYAATTPVRPEVVKAMQPFWTREFGNPSSLYKLGVQAKTAVEKARKTVAYILHAVPSEVVFTAGGSESINLAILGAARKYRETHKTGGHIITSAIEHHAVLHAVNQLAKEGFKVTKLATDAQGFFSAEQVKKSIRKDTVLVSLMYANNEIGTIEPIREIANIIKKYKSAHTSPKVGGLVAHTYPLFHTDACQAAGILSLDVQTLGVDLLSVNGSKMYGPKQTGCLYVRSGVPLQALVFGGGQEKDIRSGTENVPGIVGFAKALELVQQERVTEAVRLTSLRDYCIEKVLKKIPHGRLNGSQQNRLPNNINFVFSGAEGESVMLYLDGYNIAVATGSACSSESTSPSHVLRAIGLSTLEAKSSIRLTLGKMTTKQEIDFLIKVLPEVVSMVRKAEKL